MKIIVIKPMTTGAYKDDTTMFCEQFVKLGHTVVEAQEINGVLTIQTQIEDFKDADIIWAPYEPLIPNALNFGQEYKIPVAGHWEVIPPGRINLDNAQEHYFESETPYPEMVYNAYKIFADAYMKCDVRTITTESQKINLHRVLGYHPELTDPIYTKPYPLDTEYLDTFKKEHKHTAYQICTMSRLVPHKKLHHVIHALSLLKDPPKYVIVGEGQEREKLEQLAKNLGVDVEFKGLVSDKVKFDVLQNSRFTVHPWSWLPIGEAAHFDMFSIAYDQPDTRARLDDIPYYTESDDIKKLAENMEYLLDNPKKAEEYGKLAKEKFLAHHGNTYSAKMAAERMIKVFKQGIHK